MVESTIAAIDLDTLASLEKLSADPDFLVTLIAGFVDDSQDQLRIARGALASADISGVRDALHAMQGTSGSVGAVGVMRACVAVRNRSDDQLMSGGGALVDGLTAQLEEDRIQLERYLIDRAALNR